MSAIEAALAAAHKKGRSEAAVKFVQLVSDAMAQYPNSIDEQNSYIAGFTMELRRLAEYNKGRSG